MEMKTPGGVALCRDRGAVQLQGPRPAIYGTCPAASGGLGERLEGQCCRRQPASERGVGIAVLASVSLRPQHVCQYENMSRRCVPTPGWTGGLFQRPGRKVCPGPPPTAVTSTESAEQGLGISFKSLLCDKCGLCPCNPHKTERATHGALPLHQASQVTKRGSGTRRTQEVPCGQHASSKGLEQLAPHHAPRPRGPGATPQGWQGAAVHHAPPLPGAKCARFHT